MPRYGYSKTDFNMITQSFSILGVFCALTCVILIFKNAEKNSFSCKIRTDNISPD